MFQLELSLKLIPSALRFEKLPLISASAVFRLVLWCESTQWIGSAGGFAGGGMVVST